MPTYQYACTTCDEQLEVVQRFTDDPLTECPACGGRLRKVFSPVGVVFKGSGFYKTDSRRTSSSSSTPAASAGSAGSAGSADKAAEKPAEKPADKPAKPAASDKPAAAAS